MNDAVKPRPVARQATVAQTHPVETWVLVLNRYQRDNLLFLLNAVGWPGNNPHRDPPLSRYNMGDWVGEISIMLGKREDDRVVSGPPIEVVDENDRPNPIHP